MSARRTRFSCRGPIRQLLLALAVVGLPATSAHSLEIDSFDDGTFAFSHDQSATRRETQTGSMLGGTRIVGLSTSRRETTVSASVAAGSSELAFDTGTGPAGGRDAGRLTLTYGEGFFDAPAPPLGIDLSGFDRFLIEVLEIQGEGELSVLVNGHAFPSPIALPLTTAGVLAFSFDDVSLSGDFSDVSNIDFRIIGSTTDFSLALGGIVVAPEPGSLSLVALGVIGLIGRARARRAL